MPITLNNTPGDPESNAFAELSEANAYHETRLPLDPPWPTTGDEPLRLLIMATRILTSIFTPRKVLRWDSQGKPYYYTFRTWTGDVSVTNLSSLAWPREGMYDRNGRAIDDDVFPVELIEATSELAGQLRASDRTLDNDVIVQGLTKLKAGSVELGFKDSGIFEKVIPDAVMNLMPESWLTEEKIEYISTQEVGLGLLFEAI